MMDSISYGMIACGGPASFLLPLARLHLPTDRVRDLATGLGSPAISSVS